MKVRPVSRRLVVNTPVRSSRRASLMLGSAVLTAMSASAAMAADVIKLDTADNLEVAAGWNGAGLPTAADVAVFDSGLVTNNAFTLGAAQTWGGIRVGAPSNALTIGGTPALTIGGLGINMTAATQNLTINTPVTIAGAAGWYNWNVAAGRTLTVAAAPTKIGNNANHTGLVKFGTTGTIRLGTAANVILRDSQGNPYALYGDNDWAATDATGAVVAATYTDNTGNLTSNFALVNNIVVDALGPNATDMGGLRFNDPTPRTVVISTSATSRTATLRGILVTANSGGATIANTGGGLTANNGFIRPNRSATTNTVFPIIQNSTLGDLTVSAQFGNASTNTPVQIVKYGVGKMVVLAANSYSGGTLIQEGTIEVGGGTATLGGGAVVNNGALILNRTSGTLTLNQVISGSGSMTFSGSGTYVLGGANTYTAAPQLNGGIVEATVAGALGTSNTVNFNGGGYRYNAAYTPDLSTFTTTIGANGATIDTNGVNVAYAGPIGPGGAGGLTKAGAGTLTFNSANSYAGPTTVNGGTLAINAALGGNAIVNSGAGIAGVGPVAGSLTSNGGSISPGNAGVGTLTSSGLSLGAGSLLNIEFGTGNDQLNASGGAVTLNGGALTLLQAGSSSAFSTAGTYDIITGVGSIAGTGLSALSVANPQPGYLYTFNQLGGTVKLSIAVNGVVTGWAVDASGSWATGSNWSNGVPNAAGDAATFGPVATAARTVTLDGSRTVGGITFNNANGYTLTAGSVAGSTLTLNGNLVPTAQLNVVAGTHTIAVPVSLTSTTAQVDVATGAGLTLGAAVSGSSNLVKLGNGTLTLSNASNGYTGTTSINGGVVAVGGIGSLGTNAALNLSGGGLVRYATGMTSDLSTAKTVVLGAGGGGIDTNGNDVTFATALTGTGSLVKAGAGKLTLTVPNTHTGGVVVNGGTLSASANNQLGDPATSGAIALNTGTLEATASFSTADGGTARVISVGAGDSTVSVADTMTLTSAGAVNGAGRIVKEGPGNLTFLVANTFSGGLKVNAGVAQQNVSGGYGTGVVELASGTLSIRDTTLVNTLNISGTTGVITGGSGGGLTDLRVVNGAGSARVDITGGVFDLEGDMTGFTGTLDFQNAGGGGIRLNGTSLSAGATINLGANVTMSRRNTTLTFNIGALSGAGTIEATTAGVTGTTTYVIGAKNLDTTFDGIVRDSYDANLARIATTAITKTGSGKLTLNGFAYYSGVTTVQGGTLQLGPNAHDPVIGGPSIAVVGQTPAGADIQAGKIVFDYTAIASPADTIKGLLTTGYNGGVTPFTTGLLRSTTLTAATTLGWSADTTAQTVTVARTLFGDATLDGTVNFDDLLKLAANYNQTNVWSGGDFNYDGQVNFDDLLKLAANYNQSVTGSLGGDWALAQAAVPEPTVLTAVGAAAAMGLRRRRR